MAGKRSTSGMLKLFHICLMMGFEVPEEVGVTGWFLTDGGHTEQKYGHSLQVGEAKAHQFLFPVRRIHGSSKQWDCT